MKIRRADGWDVVRLTRFLERSARQQAERIWYPTPSTSEIKKIAWVLTLIDKGFVVLADAEEDENRRRIVGACGMSFFCHPGSDEWSLVNEFIYVQEDYRETDVADKLLTATEMFADQQFDRVNDRRVSIPIVMGVMTGETPELKDELMKRRGYAFAGSNFVRAPNHVEQHEEHPDVDPAAPELAGARESAGDDAGKSDSREAVPGVHGSEVR